MITTEILETIVNNLQGTCMTSIEMELDKLDIDANELTPENEEYVYDRVRECDDCGWWVETGELELTTDHLQVCGQCMSDHEPEE